MNCRKFNWRKRFCRQAVRVQTIKFVYLSASQISECFGNWMKIDRNTRCGPQLVGTRAANKSFVVVNKNPLGKLKEYQIILIGQFYSV